MDTWEGDYGWKAHARSGRPDLLNYLRQGDFTWPELWRFYSQRGLEPLAAVTRAMGLFHQYASWQLDLEGGTAHPEGPVLEDVLAWSRFCSTYPDLLAAEALRDQLLALVEAGSVSSYYFQCAYECYCRSVVEHYSECWSGAGSGPSDGLDAITPCVGAGRLRVYIPEDPPGHPAGSDRDWQRLKRAIAQREHDVWCASYAALMQRLEEMVDERPAL